MFEKQLPFLRPGELPGPAYWNSVIRFLRRIASRSPRLVVNERPGGGFYLDLDDEANAKYLKAGVLFDELTSILDKNPNRKTYIFLDEVHDVEGWEKTVNSIRKRENADVYITGSNSKMLSGELATYLTGRYVEFCLLGGIRKTSAPETGGSLAA